MENQETQQPVYSIYSEKFSDNSNIITDPITRETIQGFVNGVVDLNKRLERIRELRKKFGFTQQNNINAYRAKLNQNKSQQLQRDAKKLAQLAHKAKLVTAFTDNMAGC